MATIKVACPKCGQKVSGDESFFGTSVECPICTSEIRFPGTKGSPAPETETSPPAADPVSPSLKPRPEDSPSFEEKAFTPENPVPPAASPEAPPQGEYSHLPSPPENAAPTIPQPEGNQPANWDHVDDEVPSPLFGAIALICGILGIVTCVGGLLLAPLAVIFGHTALARGKHSPIQPAPGHSLAVIGTILGYLYLLFAIVALVAAVFFGGPIRELIESTKAA